MQMAGSEDPYGDVDRKALPRSLEVASQQLNFDFPEADHEL